MASGYSFQGQCGTLADAAFGMAGTTVGDSIIQSCSPFNGVLNCSSLHPDGSTSSYAVALPTCADTSVVDVGTAPLVIALVICYGLGLIAGLLS